MGKVDIKLARNERLTITLFVWTNNMYGGGVMNNASVAASHIEPNAGLAKGGVGIKLAKEERLTMAVVQTNMPW